MASAGQTLRGRIVHLFLRARAEPPSKEAVAELIKQHTQKQQGLRKGWQVKAATWVKKMHVDRGDVKVGVMKNGRFQVLDSLRPRYLVPDLNGCELKPYVQEYKEGGDDDAKASK